MKRKLILLSNRGFSLLELIVASAIVAIGMITLSTLTYIASAYSMSLQEEFNAVAESYRLEFQLRKYISLAVRVPDAPTQNFEGTFSPNFQCNTIMTAATASCPADWHVVGTFLREGSTGGLDAIAEAGLVPTAIFYRKPFHDVAGLNSESGGVVIDTGTEGALNAAGNVVAAGNVNMTPGGNAVGQGNNDLLFTQMTTFGMRRQATRGGIASLTFNATFRYHGVTKVKTWCPAGQIGGACLFAIGREPNYYDNDYSFRVSLVNNLLGQQEDNGSGLEMRVLGPIHFFQAIGTVGGQ